MLKWLVSLLASSFTFAVADVLCDICIDEQHDDDEPLPPRVETAADESDDDASASPAGKRDGERGGIEMLRLRGSGDAKYVAVADATPSAAARDDDKAKEQGVQLTGEQDAAIAGLVTIFGLGVSLCYWSATSPGGQVLGLGSSNAPTALSSLKWGRRRTCSSGSRCSAARWLFLHYYFLLKAFEGAPSTVLLPLQVASVSVLLGSSVVAALKSEPWITPVHALAYVLMFVGGILPACAGDLHALLQPAFWRQSFVIFAIAAEFALGLHDLMLSGCAYDSERNVRAEAAALGGTPAEEESVESFEFFVWSRCSFVATFIGMYALSPRLNEQLSALFSGAVASKYVILSAISEGLTILGFYLASIAYGARAARPSRRARRARPAPTAAPHPRVSQGCFTRRASCTRRRRACLSCST